MSRAENRAFGDLTTAIRTAIDGRLVDLHTALPGIVEAVHGSDQEVDVRCAVRRVVRDSEDRETFTEIPLLVRVPLWTPRVSGLSITLPVQAGDEVLVVFLERDASAWIETGAVSNPHTRRRHHLSDAVALPGLVSSPNRIPSYQSGAIEIRTDDRAGRVTVYADGTIEIRTSSSVSIGDGTEEIVSLLSELVDTITGITVDHSGARPLSAASQALLVALKARVDTLKA